MEDVKLYDKNEFVVGFTNEEREVMIVSIPLRAMAMDKVNGSALLRGKLDEAKQIALSNIQQMRAKKESVGIIKADGKPGLSLVS